MSNKVVALLKVLRPHHWLKNSLVFVPLLLSGQYLNPDLIAKALMAFAAFCLTASAGYVVNDALDVAADREHPTKRHRPFASGALPLWSAPFLTVVMLGMAFGGSIIMLETIFAVALGGYLVMTVTYSFWLKEKAIADVLMLSGLYTARLLAGGAAVGVVVSQWTLAFSMFLFVSLAFVKRHAELARLELAGESYSERRGYRVRDLRVVESSGAASGYISILVLALYINSPEMQLVYERTWPLWLICPLLFYWISRIWIVAGRGELDEDPIVYAATDRVSILVGLIAVMLVFAASAA